MLLSADLGALLLRRLIDLHLFRCLFVAIGRPRSADVCWSRSDSGHWIDGPRVLS